MVWTRIQTARYETDRSQHDAMGMARPPEAAADTAKLIGAACVALKKIYKYGYAYAKVMVMLTDLSNPAKSRRLLIDSGENKKKRENLMRLIDKINAAEGRGTLRFASQGAADAR